MTALVTPALVVVALALLSAQQEPVARRPNAVPPTEKPIVDNYATFAVGPVPASFGYDATFYKKYVDAHGIPIISSEKVPDAALLMARDIVIYMIANRPDIRAEMIAKKYRVGIMAITEMTTDIPEQRDRKKPGPADPRLTRGERENYDKPGGMAARPTRSTGTDALAGSAASTRKEHQSQAERPLR